MVEQKKHMEKKQNREEEVFNGHVVHFNKDKRYGFIKDTAGNEKYFFHITDAFPEINEGNVVSFELESGDRGIVAMKITLVQY